MNIIQRIQTALLYPLARAIVEGQSIRARVQSWGKPPKIHFEVPHAGQRILFLALYEKGELRPDILRLLAEAKAQGLYVLAVNTLKLRDPGALKHLIDCYIERPNFGRDFGSYKTGFLHVYARGWEKTCPRLVMINDSVYYATRGLSKFLSDLSTSDTEVLGATENHYMEYHLGSFCVSFAQSILQSDRLRKYWHGYRLTDIRPIVIKRGEMKLSKVLKRCVSNPKQFSALFTGAGFLEEVRKRPDLQDVVIRHSRTSILHAGPGFSITEVEEVLSESYVRRRFGGTEGLEEARVDAPLTEIYRSDMITDRVSLIRHLTRHFTLPEGADVEAILSNAIATAATQRFIRGSQIHQNAAVLLYMGLPIIKLDGVFRGVLNVQDLIRVQALLPPEEAEELGRNLLDRPFGDTTLVGWKKAAFNMGLI